MRRTVRSKQRSTRLIRPRWLVLPGLCIASASGCGSDQPNTAPAGARATNTLRLYVPNAARKPGAVLPIHIEAQLGSSSVGCIELRGEPGRATFPFAGGCSDDAESGGAEGVQARSCVTAATSAPASSSGGTSNNEHNAVEAVAAYYPAGSESVVTLFGALYTNASCTGNSTQAFLLVPLAAASGGAQGGNAPEGTGGEAGGAGSGGTAGVASGGSAGSSIGGSAPGGAAAAGDAGEGAMAGGARP